MGYFTQVPLQQAIYQRLTGDATLMALVSGVHEHVPQNANFPYVTIGDIALGDWSTKTSQGVEASAVIHVFSRGRGRKTNSDILARIATLLHDQSLTVSGQTLVLIRCEAGRIELEDDGLTYHGILRLRALLEASA